jgi:4-hydroxy-2-oxoheptanedioate aldolase
VVNNHLKKLLAEGKTAIGTFLVSGSPDLVEVCAISGMDFVIFDGEHGPTGPETAVNMIRAAEMRGITPIIRIPDHLESSILHFLDIGAHGLQVPQVNDAAAAKGLVEKSKFAPVGQRGIALARAADYGMTDLSKYFIQENEQTMLIIHCENKLCLDNLEEICRIPEIDVIFLGPYDMSQSLGIIGQITHPLIEAAAEKVLKVTKKYGKVAGIFTGSGEAARQRAQQGFRYIPIGVDLSLFGAKCVQEVASFRA